MAQGESGKDCELLEHLGNERYAESRCWNLGLSLHLCPHVDQSIVDRVKVKSEQTVRSIVPILLELQYDRPITYMYNGCYHIHAGMIALP